MIIINNIEIGKEYTTSAFLKILKISVQTFQRNKEEFLQLFKGYFDYEYYQKKVDSNRWYFKVKEILEEIPPEGLKNARMDNVMKHFSDMVAAFTSKEPHTNPTELGRYEYYINGNPKSYALSTCIAKSRSVLKSEYMINRNDRKWRAKVEEEGIYEDMDDKEIELFMTLWLGEKENPEERALDYELFLEKEIKGEEIVEKNINNYISAKIEFQKKTGKYPFYLAARNRCAFKVQ